MMKLPSLADAQKAIKGGKDPRAFLHLGIIYTQGIGTTQNEILATYFIKKALDMGCQEAKEYINMKYESGAKNFADEIKAGVEEPLRVAQTTIVRLKKRVEKERVAGNYGNLSKIRQHLGLFYPEYNQEKAIRDILNHRDTVDADILYSLCTSDNTSEIYIKSQESLLAQLFAPITNEDSLWEYIDTDMLSKDESELIQCLVNLNYSYDKICQKYDVERKELYTMESLDLYPYIKIPSLVELRKQAFRCVLSIKDVDSNIRDKYLDCLDSDEKLLNVCEAIKDQDIQLFLISFVELNIDIEALEITSLSLLRAYRNNSLQPLVDHLNDCVKRLTASGIKHNFPVYTIDNLPPIKLSVPDIADIETPDNPALESQGDIHPSNRFQKDKPLSNDVGVKGRYSIFQNSNGEIMVMIEAREGEPDNSRFIFDGNVALLLRNIDSSIVFRNIEPEAKKALQEVEEVLVVEVLNDGVEREYKVPVRFVKDVNSLIR